MTYSLAEIGTYVRGHIDLDEAELGDDMIAVWAREATTYVWMATKRWAFFETQYLWNVQVGAGSTSLTDIGADLDEIVSITGSGRALEYMGHDAAEERFLGSGGGTPTHWSAWGDSIYVWPTPEAVEALSVRGYRQPTDWVSGGLGAVPDLPEPLHNTVRLWVLGQAYMQQEDPEMGLSYLDMAANEITAFSRQLNSAPGVQPLVVGGRRHRPPPDRIPYSWE